MSIGGTTFGCTVHLATRHRFGYRNQRLAQRILDNELGCANASEAV